MREIILERGCNPLFQKIYDFINLCEKMEVIESQDIESVNFFSERGSVP